MLLQNANHLVVECDRIAGINRTAAQDEERNDESSSDAHDRDILLSGQHGLQLRPAGQHIDLS
jgi:hypothetical protein